jgi:hypothetical protein
MSLRAKASSHIATLLFPSFRYRPTSLAANEKGLFVISGLRGLMGRANKSSSSCPLEECEGGGGRAKVASSNELKPPVAVPVDANAFRDPRPAWRCCAAKESGGL